MIWLAVQIVLVGIIVFVAWSVLMVVDDGIQARLMALDNAEPAEGWGAMKRLYVWRAAVGWALPSFIVVILLAILFWSMSYTVKEIAVCRERLGMKR